MITHNHRGIRHKTFTCPTTCTLGDAEATPIQHTLAPLAEQALLGRRKACACKPSIDGVFRCTCGLGPKGKPVGRIGTLPGMPAPPSRPPLDVTTCEHRVSLDEHCEECDAAHPPKAPPEAQARGNLATLTHETNKHLRNFVRLSPEKRQLVAALTLALREGVGD